MKTTGKITSVILALTLILVSLICPGITASAYTVAEGECGDSGSSIHWTLSDMGVLTVSGTGKFKTLSDGSLWGDYKDRIKTVVINEGITYMSSTAFGNCTNLESVSLPASLEEIGGYAFVWCQKLRTVTFAAGSKLKKLGHYIFGYCNGIEELNLPGSLETITNDTFSSMEKLKSINVSGGTHFYTKEGVLFNWERDTLVFYPRGKTTLVYNVPYEVETLERGVFEKHNYLKYLNLPDSVTTFGSGAMKNSPNGRLSVLCGKGSPADTYAKENGIKVLYRDEFSLGSCGEDGGNVWWTLDHSTGELTIGGEGKMKDYTGDKPGWFDNRKEIKTVKFEKGVTSVGYEAFFGCENLSKVEFSDTVATIGTRAFYFCSSLVSVTIPKTVTTIGAEAFSNCKKLELADIPGTKTTVGANAFRQCPLLSIRCMPGSGAESYCKINGVTCRLECDCLSNSFDSRTFSPKVYVTVAVYVGDLPAGAKVYIGGEEAKRENDASRYYCVDMGQVEEIKDCKVEVRKDSAVLDKATINAETESGFFALVKSFFTNFLFNGFSWKSQTVRFW